MTVQEKIALLLSRLGSPERVAAEIGVSYRTVMRLKAGIGIPHRLTVRAIDDLIQRVVPEE